MNIFYVSIQRYQQTPTTKTKKRPTWAPEFPNLGHAFQAIVQLPELSMVDRMLMDPINRRLLSLQGNTPEVETSSAPENNHRNRTNFFRGKNEFHPQNQHVSLLSTEQWLLEEWSL